MRNVFLSAVFVAVTAASSAALHAQNAPPASSSSSSVSAPTTHKPVLPLPPAQLLALLPTPPDQWQLKESRASNFVMDWASAQAWREFTYTPPSTAAASGGAPSLPLSLRITITDTGYYQGLIGDFTGTSKSKAATVQAALVMSGFPARQVIIGKVGERLRVLVNGRYIIQIDTQNQPQGSVQRWLKLIDLTKVASLPLDGEEKLPRPYTVTKIDEIDPRNSSTSTVTYATQEEVEKSTKGHP